MHQFARYVLVGLMVFFNAHRKICKHMDIDVAFT
jgi:hypothetical protein